MMMRPRFSLSKFASKLLSHCLRPAPPVYLRAHVVLFHLFIILTFLFFAAVSVLVVDGQAGLSPLDEAVAKFLRREV